MNIRPKNIPIFLYGGVSTVNWRNPNSTWYLRSGKSIIEGTYLRLKALYDKWKTTGNRDDYNNFVGEVNKMNNDLRYDYAPNYLKYSRDNKLFSNDKVGNWQNTIRNDYGYINDAIGTHFGEYVPVSPNPTSGDNKSKEWKVDNYWAGITQDRTPWGYYNNENDIDYLDYKKKFAEIGIDYRPANKDTEWDTGNALYGFLIGDNKNISPAETPQKPIGLPTIELKPLSPIDFSKQLEEHYRKFPITNINPKKSIRIPEGRKEGGYGFDWKALGEGLKKQFPNILEAGRLIGNYYNNEKVYGELLKGIRPDLMLSYNTYRLVVGDEATKLAYYKRAAAGLTRAALPFTSDADKLMAYRFEAERAGNELKALGDLADNQRIRETSELSAQHADANRLRATEVANANLKSINYANSLRHNLLALKHSANWTSFDNFLQGIGYRNLLKLREREAIENEIFTLTEALNLAEDSEIRNARKALLEATKKHTDENGYIDTIDPEVVNAQNELRNILYRKKTESLRRKLNSSSYYFVKSGGKITHKKKDDLLYKLIKDSVEHFRKMSKMSSDALNRKRIKIEKLATHPKTLKYQLGGVAPFTIYKPIALGGETSTSSSYSGSTSSKSSNDDSKLAQDLLKELFKALAVEGLPSDTNILYNSMLNLLQKLQLFGGELSTEDIQTMYVQELLRISKIKYAKEKFDKAYEIANNNDALSEYAIDSLGRIAALNIETGKVKFLKWDEIKDSKEYNPLTNEELLNLRAYSPEEAFNYKIPENVMKNGIGISKIAEYLKAQLPNIGSSESTIEGYTKLESYEIKSGLQLLKEAPAGDYKVANYTKELLKLAAMALNYLKSILPRNMANVLLVNAEMKGISTDTLISMLIGSSLSDNAKIEFDAVTGDAADGEGKKGLEINSAVQLLLGMSSPREFTFNIGNGNSFLGLARISSINDVNEVPFGADFSYSEIYKSSLRKNLDLDNACFGDVPINKSLKDKIIVDNSTIAGVDLPYTIGLDGRIIPDFKLLKQIEEADGEIMKSGINPDKNPLAANAIYAKYGLPIKYGVNNQLSNRYKRFAVIQATAIEDVFLDKSGLASNGTLTMVSDEEEIDKYLEEVKQITGKKEIDRDRPGLFTGDKDIFKGSIFIPIIGDLTDAISGSHTGDLTSKNYDHYRNEWATKNYKAAPKQ